MMYDGFGIRVEEIAIQPEWIPPNCEWDLTKPLPYKSSSFDIIHIRSLQNRITSYTALITQVFDLLKPGGLLMIFEDFTLLPQPQSATAQTDVIPDKKVKAFFDAYKRSFKYNGMKQNSLEDVINTFRDFRGCEVKGDLIKVPIGHGSGKTTQLSKIHLINLKAWIESTRYMIVHSGGYTDDEFDLLSEALIEQIEKEELYTFYHSFSIRKA
ncbi:uncharacterized protein L201_005331 [Kwoniella dendrophila CBS 6074]|uniref:Methyltransferase type 11 domain-containing protein n=1 Tax=Kwoniella dendrophila CBS 6074 TaxID=1295534 RepID=A0AAX4JYU5_9TREE